MSAPPPWLRLQRAILGNPKFARLSLSQRGVLLTCLAATDANGRIPPLDDIAFYLGVGDVECRALLDELMGRKWLVGEVIDGEARYIFKGWENHQFKSDSSVDRTKKWRAAKAVENAASDGDVTSQRRPRAEQSRAEKKRSTSVSSTDEDTKKETALRSRPEGARTAAVQPKASDEPPRPEPVWRVVVRGDDEFPSLLLKAHPAFQKAIRDAGELKVDQDGFVFTNRKTNSE